MVKDGKFTRIKIPETNYCFVRIESTKPQSLWVYHETKPPQRPKRKLPKLPQFKFNKTSREVVDFSYRYKLDSKFIEAARGKQNNSVAKVHSNRFRLYMTDA